jgi:hypothetical protein
MMSRKTARRVVGGWGLLQVGWVGKTAPSDEKKKEQETNNRLS